MIERTTDCAAINRICNHPAVRPWLWSGTHDLDVTPVVSDPQNYALFTEHGGFILHSGPGASFEVHSQFTPEGRKSSFRAMLAGMDYMFTRTHCLQITTFLPDNNRAAQALARAGGFRPWFRRETGDVPAALGAGMQARIDIDDWICRTEDLEADGERFHAALESAGIETNHAHDPIHERYVGASLLMFERGQGRKAEALYNRWAANSGYLPIRLLSEEPPTVDVGNGATARLGATGELEVA